MLPPAEELADVEALVARHRADVEEVIAAPGPRRPVRSDIRGLAPL